MKTELQYGQSFFKGTSEYYSKYRIPYLNIMIQDLIKTVDVDRNDKLLDLACGPGRLTIPLSKYFNEIYAVDLENEMIEEGEKIAKELKVHNIKWLNGKAEEMNFDSEFFKIVTVGDAFHRLDQKNVLENSYEIIKKGGFFCIVWSNTILVGEKHWQKKLNEIISPYKKPNVQDIQQNNEETLGKFMFKDIISKKFNETIKLSIEEIIGYLYSMSVYSKDAIKDESENFENDIREGLGKIEPKNIFDFNFECEYYVGKKD